MGKEKPGFLTAKAISNRIKSKGLQKLRWFCQMCQKQCRDENGYKCHISSESHHRQMLLFDENSNHFLANYTRIFMKGYLDVLRRQFGGKRTQANVIYQEYIKDKEHVHMNSTKFTTLTGFINCLHKMGICRVDQTDKGWFIEYIAKDPEQEHLDRKKRKLDKTLREEDEQFFAQIERNNFHKKQKFDEEEPKEISEIGMELLKTDEEKIVFNFLKSESKIETRLDRTFDKNSIFQSTQPESEMKKSVEMEFIKTKLQENRPSTSSDGGNKGKPNKSTGETELIKTKKENPPIDNSSKAKPNKSLSTLEQMKREQERTKERMNRTKHWLHEGIVVKLIDVNNLPKELHNRNVVVKQLEGKFAGIAKTIDMPEGVPNKKLRIQQEHVITVVPRISEKVLIVNGGYRDCRGKLLRVDRAHSSADIELISGIHSGMKLQDVSFDDFSKLFDQD